VESWAEAATARERPMRMGYKDRTFMGAPVGRRCGPVCIDVGSARGDDGWGSARRELFLAADGKVQLQVPFGFAQGRLSTPLKYASLRMTASVVMEG
jgi:hypothetical protein